MGRSSALFCLLLGALGAVGCGGGGGGGGTSSSIASVSATCSPASITTVQTSTCSAAVTGTGSYSSAVSWAATGGAITGAGVFTPSGVGTAMITATSTQDSTKAGSTSVAVAVAPTVTGVSVIATPGNITTDQTSTCAATVTGTGAFTTDVTWSATGGTVTSDGVFTPSGGGIASCTANSTQTGYTSVSGSANITVSVVPPNITNISPRYTACDGFCSNVSYTVNCTGCENGDLFHDATGLFSTDLTLSITPGQTSFTFALPWQLGTFEPWLNTWEIEHPGGSYGISWNTAFLGTGSQSTLAFSPVTGTLFEDDQKSGQVYTLNTLGTSGTLLTGVLPTSTPTQIAVDDVSGDVAYVSTGNNPQVAVYDESGTQQCTLSLGMTAVSGIGAKGGYIVVTDPTDNLVGIAKMDCSGYQSITVAGQPWAVAMTNGTELDAYVLSRDQWSANSLPGLTKIAVSSGTIKGSVELSGLTPVSTVRASNQYGALYQVQAFTNTPIAAVLSTSDGVVQLVSTNTTGTNTMQVTQTASISQVPYAIAADETGTNPALWVAYLLASGGSTGTHIGEINLSTGAFLSNKGACPVSSVVAGGFIATSKGIYCAQGTSIELPVVLTP